MSEPLGPGSNEDYQRRADLDLAEASLVTVLIYPSLLLISAALTDFLSRHPRLLLGLFALNLLAGLSRLYFAIQVRKGTVDPRGLHFSIWAVALGWSAFCGSAVYLYGTTWTSQLCLLVTAGITAGAISTLCSRFTVFLAFALLMNVPPILILLSHRTRESFSGLVLIVFVTFTTAVCRVQSRHYREAWERRRQLSRAKEEAESLARAKDEFLAAVSHELRTPLNGILALAEQLLESELNEDQGQLTRTILTSSQSLLHIVGDILDTSTLERGALELKSEAFQPSRIAAEAVGLFKSEAEGRELELTFRSSLDEPVWVVGDPERLRQILWNLVGNALKFTETGEVQVELREDPRGLLFTVLDSGRGISEKEGRRIFEAFAQVDSGTTRRFGGVGLGLYIASNLALEMGGYLFYESRSHLGGMVPPDREPEGVDTGTRFSLLVDLERTEPVVSSTAQELGDFSKLEVLVVEDHEINQQVILRLLSRYHIQADLAANGREALARCREREYDLVLMDIQMPELDGYQATRQLRQVQGEGHRPWVVALTANAREIDRRRCVEAGMDDFLAKPIRRLELGRALEKCLRTKVEMD